MEKKCPTYKEIAMEMDAREKRHHESLQKIRQQAETIVTEIYRASKLQQLLFEFRFNVNLYEFDGKIGDDIHFFGEYHESDYPNKRSNSNATINLFCAGERLGKIITYGGFVDAKMPGWISNWQGDNQDVKQPIADTTEITIISPAWFVLDGIGSIYYPKDVTRKVEIKHAPKERAEDVLDRIYRTVMRSKQKAINAEKLSKLNLATNRTQDNVREK